MSHLNRHQAPFPETLWERIDDSARVAARDQLTTRRFLDLEGPYGPGLTTLEVGDDRELEEGAEAVSMTVSPALPVPMLKRACRLSVRRMSAHLESGAPLDLTPVEDAAEAVARAEEQLVYAGEPRRGIRGLAAGEGQQRQQCGDWAQMNDVLNDVLAGVTRLDDSGLRGPYALVLPPQHYNRLFRRYEHSDLLQLDHLKSLCQAGVYKAEVERPLVLDVHAGTLILGQDLQVGYAGTDGAYHHLFLSESLVLRLDAPEAVCLLEAG